MTEHEFFSHITAAVAYGCPLPLSALAGRPLDSAVLAPRRLPRTAGVRGHQAVPALTRVRRDPWTGLILADPATTWAMLGGVLIDLYDLVAAGEAFVRDWRVDRPLATIEELTAATNAGRRVGVARLRAALPLIRTGSASRTETWCRLTICAAGLPEPELNVDVVVNGVRIACVDMAYPRYRVAVEYEGEHHLLNAEQWARDIERYDALRDAGWRVIRVTRVDLFRHPERMVERVRAALASRA